MEKIYAKFVKDRKKEFQIETALWTDQGKILVTKRNLFPEGAHHIQKIFTTYEMYREREILCDCELKEDGEKKQVVFSYVKGVTLEECLVDALQEKKKESVESIAAAYLAVAEKIFREEDFQDGAYKNAIFDLTFDNLIGENGQFKIIDYEWRFETPVDKEFIIFRAVYAFYMKHAGLLQDMYTEEEFYGLFHVSLAKKEQYLRENETFIAYVYGENGYNKILEGYKKLTMPVCEQDVINYMRAREMKKQSRETPEDTAFLGILGLIEENKTFYDDYEKFFTSTKKIRETMPAGYLLTDVFADEVKTYLRGNYDMISYYKDSVDGKEKVIGEMADMIEKKDREQADLQQKYSSDCEKLTAHIRSLEQQLNYIKSCKAYHLFLEKKVNEQFGQEE